MKPTQPEYDCGVIVGRFQVHDLHEGHTKLIDYVCDKHTKVIVVLGSSPVITKNDPLDFEARKQMLLNAYPDLNVLYMKDVSDDAVWSRGLDKIVADVVSPTQSVVLYGGRDSFVHTYEGRYPTEELIQEGHTSGTEVRRTLAKSVIGSPDFRAGVIWAAHNRFPTCYTTVDVAIFNEDYTKILLGRKPGENKFRLIGGFAEPSSDCFEDDARREVLEEAGVILETIEYLVSSKVQDWRYAGSPDKIKTLMFVGTVNHLAKPIAADDIEEVQWFDVTGEMFDTDKVMPLHQRLVSKALMRAATKRRATVNA